MNRHAIHSRGFTLVEVMIVVVIIAVLSTLAVYAVSGYVRAAKMSEAPEMLQSIKAAQESYKDETFTYLSVSPNLDSLYPTKKADLSDAKTQWGAADSGDILKNFQSLGVSSGAPLRFGYACVAGSGGTLPTDSEVDLTGTLNYPGSPGGPWYVVKAVGNIDTGNEDLSIFISSSFTDEIYSEVE
jgi:prepilin-type N-terminal cleavage/methylation domain-containing protein